MQHETADRDSLLEKPSPRRRRGWRTLAGVIGGVVIVVAIALVGAVPVIGGRLAPGLIESAVSEAIEGDVDVTSVALGWGGPQFATATLSAPDGGLVGTFDIVWDRSLLGVLLDPQHLGSVTISGHADVVVLPDGRSNLAAAVASRSDAGAPGGVSGEQVPGGAEPVDWPQRLRASLFAGPISASVTTSSGERIEINGLEGSVSLSGPDGVTEVAASVTIDGEDVLHLRGRARGLRSRDGALDLSSAEGELNIVAGAPLSKLESLARALAQVPEGDRAARVADDARVETQLALKLENGRLISELGAGGEPTSWVRVPLPDGVMAALAGDGGGLVVDERPTLELLLGMLDTPLDPNSDGWDSARVRTEVRLSEVSGRLDEGAGSRFELDPTTITLAGSPLDRGVSVVGVVRGSFGGEAIRGATADLRMSGLVDSGGRLLRTLPRELSGRIDVPEVPTVLVERVASVFGAELPLDAMLGEGFSVTLAAEVEPVEGGREPVATLNLRADRVDIDVAARYVGGAVVLDRPATIEVREVGSVAEAGLEALELDQAARFGPGGSVAIRATRLRVPVGPGGGDAAMAVDATVEGVRVAGSTGEWVLLDKAAVGLVATDGATASISASTVVSVDDERGNASLDVTWPDFLARIGLADGASPGSERFDGVLALERLPVALLVRALAGEQHASVLRLVEGGVSGSARIDLSAPREDERVLVARLGDGMELGRVDLAALGPLVGFRSAGVELRSDAVEISGEMRLDEDGLHLGDGGLRAMVRDPSAIGGFGDVVFDGDRPVSIEVTTLSVPLGRAGGSAAMALDARADLGGLTLERVATGDAEPSRTLASINGLRFEEALGTITIDRAGSGAVDAVVRGRPIEASGVAVSEPLDVTGALRVNDLPLADGVLPGLGDLDVRGTIEASSVPTDLLASLVGDAGGIDPEAVRELLGADLGLMVTATGRGEPVAMSVTSSTIDAGTSVRLESGGDRARVGESHVRMAVAPAVLRSLGGLEGAGIGISTPARLEARSPGMVFDLAEGRVADPVSFSIELLDDLVAARADRGAGGGTRAIGVRGGARVGGALDLSAGAPRGDVRADLAMFDPSSGRDAGGLRADVALPLGERASTLGAQGVPTDILAAFIGQPIVAEVLGPTLDASASVGETTADGTAIDARASSQTLTIDAGLRLTGDRVRLTRAASAMLRLDAPAAAVLLEDVSPSASIRPGSGVTIEARLATLDLPLDLSGDMASASSIDADLGVSTFSIDAGGGPRRLGPGTVSLDKAAGAEGVTLRARVDQAGAAPVLDADLALAGVLTRGGLMDDSGPLPTGHVRGELAPWLISALAGSGTGDPIAAALDGAIDADVQLTSDAGGTAARGVLVYPSGRSDVNVRYEGDRVVIEPNTSIAVDYIRQGAEVFPGSSVWKEATPDGSARLWTDGLTVPLATGEQGNGATDWTTLNGRFGFTPGPVRFDARQIPGRTGRIIVEALQRTQNNVDTVLFQSAGPMTFTADRGVVRLEPWRARIGPYEPGVSGWYDAGANRMGFSLILPPEAVTGELARWFGFDTRALNSQLGTMGRQASTGTGDLRGMQRMLGQVSQHPQLSRIAEQFGFGMGAYDARLTSIQDTLANDPRALIPEIEIRFAGPPDALSLNGPPRPVPPKIINEIGLLGDDFSRSLEEFQRGLASDPIAFLSLLPQLIAITSGGGDSTQDEQPSDRDEDTEQEQTRPISPLDEIFRRMLEEQNRE